MKSRSVVGALMTVPLLAVAAPAAAAPAGTTELPPGRYCGTPAPGQICLYEHAGGGGNSIAYSRCGAWDIPSWLDNRVSSYNDRDGSGYLDIYWQFPGTGGWNYVITTSDGFHDMPFWANDLGTVVQHVRPC